MCFSILQFLYQTPSSASSLVYLMSTHLPRPSGFLILEYITNQIEFNILPQFQTPMEGN